VTVAIGGNYTELDAAFTKRLDEDIATIDDSSQTEIEDLCKALLTKGNVDEKVIKTIASLLEMEKAPYGGSLLVKRNHPDAFVPFIRPMLAVHKDWASDRATAVQNSLYAEMCGILVAAEDTQSSPTLCENISSEHSKVAYSIIWDLLQLNCDCPV
jgi:hypothetical protein